MPLTDPQCRCRCWPRTATRPFGCHEKRSAAGIDAGSSFSSAFGHRDGRGDVDGDPPRAGDVVDRDDLRPVALDRHRILEELHPVAHRPEPVLAGPELELVDALAVDRDLLAAVLHVHRDAGAVHVHDQQAVGRPDAEDRQGDPPEQEGRGQPHQPPAMPRRAPRGCHRRRPLGEGGQGLGGLERGLISGFGLLGHHPGDDLGQARRAGRGGSRAAVGARLRVRGELLEQRPAGERGVAGEQEIQGAAEAVEVRAGCRRSAGRRPARGRCSRPSRGPSPSAVTPPWRPTSLAKRARPKSRTLTWPRRRPHQVLRLDVAVDHPVLVGVLEPQRRLPGVLARLGRGQRAALADVTGPGRSPRRTP